MRKLLLSGLGLFAILIVLFVTLVAVSPAVRERLSLLPLYIETTISQYRPTPVVPTPPAESAFSPQELLQTRPEPTPTLFPTSTPPATAPPATPPSATPSPTATPTATPIPVTPAGSGVLLSGFSHDWQTWNNCGPTTISMNLSFYGVAVDQATAAQSLKPNRDDKNVSPEELAGYAQSQGLEALVRVGGTAELLQKLLSNGFPVIVETWLEPEDRGGLGHYRLFSGYDAAGGFFVAQDSLRGPDVQVPLAGFDELWRVFNRKYVVVYRPEEVERVAAILGPAANDELMLAAALATAQSEAQANPADPYAWFNIGSTYTMFGEMELAASAFDEARRIGLPFRMLWYQLEIFMAYYETGRYQDVIDLATATLQGSGGLEELYYYRGLARRALGDEEQAVADFRAALDYNPLYEAAAMALEG